jgi:hypothetical protein
MLIARRRDHLTGRVADQPVALETGRGRGDAVDPQVAATKDLDRQAQGARVILQVDATPPVEAADVVAALAERVVLNDVELRRDRAPGAPRQEDLDSAVRGDRHHWPWRRCP